MIHEKLIVPRLEIHVSDFCNLKCDNCNHFSNYGISGYITLEEYKNWNIPWSRKILPRTYQLLGGEPTLNPHLVEICTLSRDIWNKSKILLISNGFFLDKHPELPRVLEKNKIQLVISVHDNSEEYNEKLKKIKNTISTWKNKYNFDFNFRESYENWTRTFLRDIGGNTIPYEENNPKLSFSNCLSKESKQIYKSCLYKCPPLTYLNLVKNKFQMSEKWDFYLGYKPLSPNCTTKELKDFFSLKEESYCNMCASNPVVYKKENPLIQLNINIKNSKF